MLQSFSQRYETEPYNTGAGGGTADYVFAMMFGTAMIFLSYPFMMMLLPTPPMFARTLMFFVLYVWSKRHPTSPTSIWGIEMKAIHLPFAYVILSVLMGGMYADLLHGIAVGHLFYFLVDVVPIVYGKDMLHTPQFLIDQLGVGAYVAPNPTVTAGTRGARAMRSISSVLCSRVVSSLMCISTVACAANRRRSSWSACWQ